MGKSDTNWLTVAVAVGLALAFLFVVASCVGGSVTNQGPSVQVEVDVDRHKKTQKPATKGFKSGTSTSRSTGRR